VTRFAIEPKYVYSGGMSGGARVASGVAIGSSQVAGVLHPVRDTLQGSQDGPVCGGRHRRNENFNLMEMRQLDRGLTSPHRVVVFEGGHVWLSSELAVQAVEWMELEAMKSGRKPTDRH
jgi:hypothetical protein